MHLFAQSNANAWIAAAAAIAVALITATVAIAQSRSSRRLEREKIELEYRLDQRADARKKAAEQARATETKAAEVEERLKRAEAQADERGRRAIEYRRKVIDRLRNLKILDMSRSLDLDRLYVQLRVKEEEPLRFVSDEAIAELASGAPEQILRLSRERLRGRSAESLPPEAALARFTRIVVLGDPGAGKTTMLRYLAFRGAREELDGITLPVYVELREFIDSGETDLLAYAAGDMARRYGFWDAGPYIEDRFDSGDAVLLLDGLDEVLGGDNADAATRAYQLVASEAARLATRYPDLAIAITCRKAGWRGGLSQFQTLEVLDFDWPEIQEFIGNWFSETPDKAGGLRGALERNLRMQTLAANPLLLSLIAIVYERDLELPERRAELYNRCVEVMLKDWDAHRDIKRFSLFTADRKRDLLEEIAWHFHGAGLRYFPKADLLGIIDEFLPTIDIEPGHAEAILGEIVTQYGLLKEQARGWYGFLHLTLQEYFTAYAAHERGAAAVARVVRSRHDPWWEEVILLLAGRLSDASALILGILGRSPDSAEPPAGEPLAVDDDLFRGDLLLAGRCLASRPRLRASWLRDRLLRETWDLLRTSSHEGLLDSAAAVLVEAGGPASRDEVLAHITDDDAPAESRCALVAALDAARAVETAPELLAFLDRTGYASPDVNSAIIPVLADLRYQESVPVFLKLLRVALAKKAELPFEQYRVADRCCQAVGDFGGAFVKAELWNLVDHEVASDDDSPLLSCLLSAIGELGDSEDAERLFNLPHDTGSTSLGEAAGISGAAIASRLIGIAGDPGEGFSRAIDAVYALRGIPESGVSGEVLRVIADPGVNVLLRESLVASLSGDRPGCERELSRLLDDPAVERSVKIEIAAVFAGWGSDLGIPYLRMVFEYWDEFKEWSLRAAAEALGKLGVYEYLPTVIAGYVSEMSGDLGDWGPVLESYETAQPALPMLYAPLESGMIPSTDSIIPKKIGDVADTPEDAERLLRLFLGSEEQARGEAEALFKAIRTVSERARVRVFTDGRVDPVGG